MPAAPGACLPHVAEREVLSDHLITLTDEADNPWALWRTLAVRGAGFPAAEVLRIADAEGAAAADRLADAQDEAERLRQAALESSRRELQGCGKERLDSIVKAIRGLKRGRPPRAEGLAAETAAAVEAFRDAAGRAEGERARYREAFAAAEERVSRALGEVARGERFREAVLWQNRHAARTALAGFLRRPEDGPATSKQRTQERMLASYLQRYCVKNDTIGFFGPVGWARLGEGDEAVAVRPGPGLLAARRVYFEGWAIDALADALAAEPAMRPWLVPRRSPYLRREGAWYFGPKGQRVQLGPVSTALYDSCDGIRPARELIRALIESPALAAPGESVLYGLLGDFQAKGLVSWTFQIPLSLTPERTLRELLLAVEDTVLRERALALLDGIVTTRDSVARAAGDADELDRALGELEATFTSATGLAPRRAQGELYAGRTLVYEECRRDLDLELGAPFLDDLAPALSLVLASARWYTGAIAEHHRELLGRIHAEMSREAGRSSLDLLSFSARALPALVNFQVQQELPRELHARWERVLVLPAGARRVAYTSAELGPRVRAEFAAAGPGWQRARVHSPDLLVDAAGIEAIRRGDYQVVLGEIHLAVNTLDRGVFFSQHPSPERLAAAMEADLPQPTIVPVMPKHWRPEAASRLGFRAPGFTARVDVGARSAKDFHLDLSLDPPCAPLSRVLRIGELVVEPGAGDGLVEPGLVEPGKGDLVEPGKGGLVVASREQGVRFDLVDFYQVAMMLQAVRTFTLLPARAHTPRITIDRLVVTRESWVFPATDLAFTAAAAPAERFAGARRWARAHGLPRFVFTKTPFETKPFYLDLESPVLIEVFAHEVRRAARARAEAGITVTEMLPAPGGAWLPDAQGNRYTCELRMVAVDRS